MEELFRTRGSLVDKISYCHLLLFLASLPFDRFYSHIILISFALHTIIHFKKKNIRPFAKLNIFLLQSVFFVTVISTIYATNKAWAFNDWGKQITILLFPVIFYFSGFDLKKYKNSLLLGFSMVCTLTVIYLYSNAFYTIRFYKLPLTTLFSVSFTNHNFSEPIDMHATFFSMQLAIALVCLLSVIIQQQSKQYKWLYAFCILILIGGLIQLSSKSVFFCLFLIINFAIPFFLLPGRQRWRFMLISLGISAITVTGILKLSAFKERYVTELQTDLSEAETGESTEPRLARWDVAGELIKKSPVIGYGAGSEVPMLKEAFYKKKYYNSFLHSLNSHNEYLSFLFKSGVYGLLVYLAALLAGFKTALKKKDLLFFTFMLLIALVSLSENILDVDKGIIFYAFFFSFFMFSASVDNQRLNRVNNA